MTAIQRAYTERPILFSAPMVRAILAGEKTQTRRVIKPQPRCNGTIVNAHAGEIVCEDDYLPPSALLWDVGKHKVTVCDLDGSLQLCCPYGAPGDRLWVRETFHLCPHCERVTSYRAGGWREAPSGAPDDGGDRCDTDDRPLSPKCAAHGWKPSIHMPRWASRITLEVTSVRVERLQDITAADAKAEGLDIDPSIHGPGPNWDKRDWAALWMAINDEASWMANPWVWVVEFKRV